MGTQNPASAESPLSPSQLQGCVQGGMKASTERPHCHKYLLSLLRGKTSMDGEFGSGNGECDSPALNTSELVAGH